MLGYLETADYSIREEMVLPYIHRVLRGGDGGWACYYFIDLLGLPSPIIVPSNPTTPPLNPFYSVLNFLDSLSSSSIILQTINGFNKFIVMVKKYSTDYRYLFKFTMQLYWLKIMVQAINVYIQVLKVAVLAEKYATDYKCLYLGSKSSCIGGEVCYRL